MAKAAHKFLAKIMKTKITIIAMLLAATFVSFGQFGPSAVLKYPYTNTLKASDVFPIGEVGVTNKNLAASNLLNAAIGAAAAGGVTISTIPANVTGSAATVTSVAGNAAQVAAIMATNSTVVFNVEKYGAAPGVESTVGIQAAINAAQAVAGIVYFPSNNYLTSNTLTFSSAVHFKGNSSSDSVAYTIVNTTGSDVLRCDTPTYRVSIKNMSFSAPESASSTNVVLQFSTDPDHGFGLANLENITIKGGAVGLRTTNFFTSEIKDVRFLGQHIGAHFNGVAVGRIKIEGGGAGSGNGIGYLIEQGTYFVFDGVDCGAITNMIKVNRAAFVTLQNCNLEGGLLSSDDTIDRAYILFNPANSSGLLRVINTRFGAGNGSPLTLSHSITVSNASLEVGGGNTWSHVGPTGQPVEEWGTIPCPTYVTELENYGAQLWVTNRTVNVARKARQHAQDLQNSGRSSNFSNPLYWGAVWYDSRTNSDASDALYYHAKMGDGTYRGIDLYAPYKDSFITGRFGIGSNAHSGWSGAGTVSSGLDIALNQALTIGSDASSVNRTTATAKRGRIGGAPYTTSRLQVSLLESYNDASHNTALWGGGWTGYDAVTRHRFYAASAIQTTVGTLNFEITHTGVYANTNFHAVAVTATNFIAMPTNYVAANFAPVSGMVKLVTSNDWIYSVTTLTTNRAFQINP